MPPAASPTLAQVRRTGTLRYVRHGATAPNLAGLRCGGDLDVSLHEHGRLQAIELARAIAELQPAVGLLITSPLARTLETAQIIAAALPGVRIHVEEGLAERRLGRWNLKPIELTQAWLEAGMTPPGGEPNDEFVARVGLALQRTKPLLVHRPLLVGSKGVARAIGEHCGRPERVSLGNAELDEFRLADMKCLETAWGPL
jgi:probable phosphoglycerate mutase